ncbi:class C sortase [Lacticaseibacillus porcinae]|uniref:class C sortase n=1 Tax=Lacticaseibacillus porcinae TaxID=1123687 RepID=UPI000F77FD4A|nr:class C sortase [Lacticaseibacillus porcinae]
MSKRFKNLLVLLLFFTGLGIFAYPFVASGLNTVRTQFNQQRLKDQAAVNAKRDLAKKKAENAELAANGIRPSGDVFKETSKSASAKYLNDHLIGAVSIPTIDLYIPLYDRTNDLLLQSGATVLGGTSYPTGGPSTHTVISAHAALPTKQLFTNLKKVKIGQRFILTVGNKRLAYQVERIDVVLPQNVSKLKIEPGRDLATLMTCTPYGVNSHRLLVTGKRVPLKNVTAKSVDAAAKRQWWQAVAKIAAALIALIIFIILVIRTWRKHRPK